MLAHMPRARVQPALDSDVPSEVVSDGAPPKRARRAPRKPKVVAVEAGDENNASPEVSPPKRTRAPVRRKAPRVVAEPERVQELVSSPSVSSRPSKTPYIVVGVLLAGSLIVSAAIGYTDVGRIDVVSRANEQLALQAGVAGDGGGDAGSESVRTIPVQNSVPATVPNGGLRGRGMVRTPADEQAAQAATVPAPVEVASTTATTTPDTTESSEVTDETSVSEVPDEQPTVVAESESVASE